MAAWKESVKSGRGTPRAPTCFHFLVLGEVFFLDDTMRLPTVALALLALAATTAHAAGPTAKDAELVSLLTTVRVSVGGRQKRTQAGRRRDDDARTFVVKCRRGGAPFSRAARTLTTTPRTPPSATRAQELEDEVDAKLEEKVGKSFSLGGKRHRFLATCPFAALPPSAYPCPLPQPCPKHAMTNQQESLQGCAPVWVVVRA